jgi:2-keto-4-pentenoate hydratase/2-oxohepta-3-ene-1,7-dioic acid hydratase in catechol pathway
MLTWRHSLRACVPHPARAGRRDDFRVMIDKRAVDLRAARAEEHVSGQVVTSDLRSRGFQREHHQRVIGKSLDIQRLMVSRLATVDERGDHELTPPPTIY